MWARNMVHIGSDYTSSYIRSVSCIVGSGLCPLESQQNHELQSEASNLSSSVWIHFTSKHVAEYVQLLSFLHIYSTLSRLLTSSISCLFLLYTSVFSTVIMETL